MSKNNKKRFSGISRVTIIFVALVLLLQIVNTAVYYHNNYSDVQLTRQTRLNSAAQSVENSFDELNTVLCRILEDPVALEFQYRSNISGGNAEKLQMLLRNLINLELGGGNSFRIYLCFPRSGLCYNSLGIVSTDLSQKNRLYVSGLELSPDEPPTGDLALPGVTVETCDGVYSADVVAVFRPLVTAIAVLPKSAIDARLEAAVAETGSAALVLNENGVVIADYGDLPLPANCSSVEEYYSAMKAQYGKQYTFEYLENAGSFGRDSISVLIGFDRSTHTGGSLDLTLYTLLSCACFLVITGLFIAVFTREIYSPMKNIVNRLSRQVGQPEQHSRNEFLFVNSSLNMLDSRLKSMSSQLEKHDELYLENVLARLSMDIGAQETLQYTERNRRYFVLTAASESDGGDENLETVERISTLLYSRFRTKRFYHQGRQWSFYIEASGEECASLLKALASEPLESFTFIGLSRIHNDLLELRDALEESWAVFTFPLGPDARDRLICQYSESGSASGLSPNINMREESALVNNLLSANSEAVERGLNAIIDNNRSLSFWEQRELYVYLLKLLLVTQRGSGIEFPDDESALSRIKHSYNVKFMQDATLKRYLSVAAELAPDDGLLQNIQRYVHENYASDVYLQIIADKFGLSYSYVSRYFKRKSGVGFSDYVTQVRIGKAKELLTTTNMSISDISRSTGFDVLSSFNRSFKKNTGVSPGEYRNLYSAKVSE